MTRWPETPSVSSRSTDRQPSTASYKFCSSSSKVSPWVAQTGMEGTSAQSPPSSASWTITLSFILVSCRAEASFTSWTSIAWSLSQVRPGNHCSTPHRCGKVRAAMEEEDIPLLVGWRHEGCGGESQRRPVDRDPLPAKTGRLPVVPGAAEVGVEAERLHHLQNLVRVLSHDLHEGGLDFPGCERDSGAAERLWLQAIHVHLQERDALDSLGFDVVVEQQVRSLCSLAADEGMT